MRSLSLQQSLLEEILAIQDILEPFPNIDLSSNFPENSKTSHPIKPPFKTRQRKSIEVIRTPHANQTVASTHNNKPNSTKLCSKRTKTQYIDPEQNIHRQHQSTTSSNKKDRCSLYEKATLHQNYKKAVYEVFRNEQQLRELEECTHQPQFNNVSMIIADKIDREALKQKLKEKREKQKEQLIKQAQERQLRECSFTPNLKNTKPKTTSSRFRNSICTSDYQSINPVNVSVFDTLYEESKNRQRKQREQQKQYLKQISKQPKIDPVSDQIAGNSNFQQRMNFYAHKKKQKQLALKERIDKENRELYRPQINPTSKRRTSEIPVTDRLYAQSQNQKSMKASINLKEERKSIITKKSNQVYEERKVLVFYQLFKLLDDDEDGVISIQQMNLQNLPRQIVQIIYPLIEELDNLQVELQEHEFVSSLFNLFKTLTVHEKDTLLGFGAKKPQQIEPSFQPKINQKSKVIVEGMNRSDYSIYEYCQIKAAERKREIEAQRAQQEAKQIEGCTFKPKTIKRHRY